MKTELDLLRPLFPSYDVATVTVRTDCRRVMNVALNEMIHGGLFANSLTALANQMMPVMGGTCQVLTALNTEPEVEDFIHAAAEMASFVRHTMDEALKLDNIEDVRLSAVMVEIMIKGISSALGLPYDVMLKASAEGTVEFTEILTASGHVKAAS